MANRQVGMIIQESNVFINGKGYLGVTKAFKVPTLEQNMVEGKAALGAEYGTGTFKPMELEVPVKILDFNLYAAFGLNNLTNRIPLLFKASVHQSGETKKTEVSLAVTGDCKSIEHGGGEAGSELEVTLKVAVHFMTLVVDGKPVMVYDSENMIAIIGGVDYMAQVRSNLGE